MWHQKTNLPCVWTVFFGKYDNQFFFSICSKNSPMFCKILVCKLLTFFSRSVLDVNVTFFFLQMSRKMLNWFFLFSLHFVNETNKESLKMGSWDEDLGIRSICSTNLIFFTFFFFFFLYVHLSFFFLSSIYIQRFYIWKKRERVMLTNTKVNEILKMYVSRQCLEEKNLSFLHITCY